MTNKDKDYEREERANTARGAIEGDKRGIIESSIEDYRKDIAIG